MKEIDKIQFKLALVGSLIMFIAVAMKANNINSGYVFIFGITTVIINFIPIVIRNGGIKKMKRLGEILGFSGGGGVQPQQQQQQPQQQPGLELYSPLHFEHILRVMMANNLEGETPAHIVAKLCVSEGGDRKTYKEYLKIFQEARLITVDENKKVKIDPNTKQLLQQQYAQPQPQQPGGQTL